jgi:surfeit locus 1 family protein
VAWRVVIRPVPAATALVLFAIGIAAGNWQQGRAREKAELQQRMEQLTREAAVVVGAQPLQTAGLEFRRVSVRGQWQPEFLVFLDNKPRLGAPGYHVLMPLRIEGSNMHVLVNRGWAAASRDRARQPAIATAGGTVEITGEARVPGSKFLELSGQYAEGRLWQNLTIDRYRQWSQLALQPIVMLQMSAADDGLIREWGRPDMGIDKHRGYAFQWYALSAVVAVFSIVLAVRRQRDEA